jgi:hypothetical protein
MMELWQMIPDFAECCVSGNVSRMRTILRQADTDPIYPSETLRQLLEKRETTQRLTPLLLIMSMGKQLKPRTSYDVVSSQLKAVQLLLEYGARPDAKDVCGKTVCHYGMGPYATDMSLQAGA